MTEMMLDIRNLRVSIPTDRGKLNAVRGVDLQIAKGETLCLVGESGCGKSLTATSIMGLLPRYAKVTTDRFEMAGQDLTIKTDAKLANLRGRDVAMIFQDPTSALNPTLTIGRQLTEGVMRHEKLSRKDADARAIEMLDRVGIANPAARLTQYPHGFSGGQRQRIMIASALMGRPKLLIADEPTTALDVTTQAQILDLIAELKDELKMAVMLITHDLGVVAEVADDVAVMYMGKIVEKSDVYGLFENPQHPYTRALLDSVPRIGMTAKGRLPAIRGMVPHPLARPSGCTFRTRCDHFMAGTCDVREPRLKQVGEGQVACFLHDNEDARLKRDEESVDV